jgi:cysteinyl-tRNA synthetase
LVKRYLLFRGYKVKHVMNITDIDDKTIKKALEQNTSLEEVTAPYTQSFFRDLDKLNILRADVYPRATEHIKEMVDLIEKLEDRGYAYIKGKSVYFSIRKFEDYGRLANIDKENLRLGSSVDSDDYDKEDVQDFVLWKGKKEGEPSWPTKYGDGRPGWHIECSAMSQRLLGETFDIHGGGADLIFPHHENEIAQSEGATGKPFVKYWIHNGFVNINQEKMSKSLDNFFTIREILEHYHPEAVRLFLLSHHYRSPVDFSDQNLKEAQMGLDRLYTLLKDFKEMHNGEVQSSSPHEQEMRRLIESLPETFEKAMDDDFNTASALGILQRTTRDLNRVLAEVKKDGSGGFPSSLLEEGVKTFTTMGNVLGILTIDPMAYFQQKQDEGMKEIALSEDEILKFIEERKTARANKDWKRADEIRDELINKGIILEDSPQGTTWKVK